MQRAVGSKTRRFGRYAPNAGQAHDTPEVKSRGHPNLPMRPTKPHDSGLLASASAPRTFLRASRLDRLLPGTDRTFSDLTIIPRFTGFLYGSDGTRPTLSRSTTRSA